MRLKQFLLHVVASNVGYFLFSLLIGLPLTEHDYALYITVYWVTGFVLEVALGLMPKVEDEQ